MRKGALLLFTAILFIASRYVDFSPVMDLIRANARYILYGVGGVSALAGAVFLYYNGKGKSRRGIPDKMRAVMLVKHSPTSMSSEIKDWEPSFEVHEVDTPRPRNGQVLVKMMASPINPSDLSTFKGSYNAAQRSNLPCTVGFEGAGVVVQSGGGFFGGLRAGQRVACVTKGSGSLWAEYAVVPAMQTIPLPDSVSFKEGCSCFVNPWTALSFIEITKKGKHKSMILTAAASSLCKMVLRLAKRQGIRVICIVRRRSHEDTLRELGAAAVVVTTEDDWKEDLTRACKDYNCRIGFDAVAGPNAGTILSCMPPKSTIHVYGGLSNKPISAVRPTDLIFKGSSIRGYWLTGYLKTKGLLGALGFVRTTQRLLASDLKTDIRASYPLENAADAIVDYCSNMSQGKVAICPNDD